MNAKVLAEMSVDATEESVRQRDKAVSCSTLAKKSIARRAAEIADKPDTPTMQFIGLQVKKVAEWTDKSGIEHYIVYVRPRKIVSVALTSNSRPSGRKRSTHDLYTLPAGHLYEHFAPLMV